MSRRTIRCRTCDRFRPHEAHGLCRVCYDAVRRPVRGRYDGPNGASTQHHPRNPDAVESRIAGYRLLRSAGVKRAEAARRVGISYRTAARYDQRIKDQT